MSVGVDLGQLGGPAPAAYLAQDQGFSGGQTPNDLMSTLPQPILGQDAGNSQISLVLDLQNTLGIPAPLQDVGPSFIQQAASDTGIVGPMGVQSQNITDAYWQIVGFDTVALTTITWAGTTPLAPPPTQNPVNILSVTRLV